MKVSNLIEKLQRVQNEIGDVEVKITDGFDCECYGGDFYVGAFEFDGDKFVDIGIGGMKVDGWPEENAGYNYTLRFDKIMAKLRFDKIMAKVDKWAEENAVFDCWEDAVQEVELLLSGDAYREWSDEQIVEAAIKAWKIAE